MSAWVFIYLAGGVVVAATVAQGREVKRLALWQRWAIISAGALLWPLALIVLIAIKATDFIDKAKRP